MSRKYKRPLSSYITEAFFWLFMAAITVMLVGVIYSQFNKAHAGGLAECETDYECELFVEESLRLIDQNTIPPALKWYCAEYPTRYLGNGPMAKTFDGKAIEIESCEQVLQSQEYDRV